MYKKITVVLFAIMMFFIPIQSAFIPNEADAFISKLLGISAKKVAKEVIKDMAVETAVNMALNEAFKIADAQQKKYDVQDAYKVVCLYGLTGEVCDKPVGIKENLTEADKIAIGHQAELELDKLITDGRGFTRWEKFLDWFGPLWVTALATTALTYAFDPDTRSLFNEAGYNALVALGIIQPVYDAENSIPLKDVQLSPAPADTSVDPINEVHVYSKTSTSTGHMSVIQGNGVDMSIHSALYQQKYETTDTNRPMDYYSVSPISTHNLFELFLRGNRIHLYNVMYPNVEQVVVAKNGETIDTITTKTDNGSWQSFQFVNSQLITDRHKIIGFLTRSPYKLGEKFYTDILITLSTGDYYEIQIKSTGIGQTTTGKNIVTNTSFYQQNVTMKNTLTIRDNVEPRVKILVPTYPEVETEFDPSDNSSYVDEGGGQIAIIPPTALPHRRISTGEPLEVQPNPIEGGEPIYVAPDGTIVPEDDVEIGEPNISKSPEGVPQVTPQPTQNNPSPEPIPLTPTTPTPTPEDPPVKTPVETEPPVFPEGESCSEGLKFPKFKQLGETVSHGFPFSLPFDIYRGFNNVFADLGTEKPQFEYKFKFMGDEQVWKIALPDYFDSWKRFTDILLVVFFDITLLYLFNRFFGATGSD